MMRMYLALSNQKGGVAVSKMRKYMGGTCMYGWKWNQEFDLGYDDLKCLLAIQMKMTGRHLDYVVVKIR